MTGLGHDLRYAVRQMRRNPAFTVAAALTLALGIAATTTVFSFVDAALLRPLPYPEADRIFVLWNERGDKRQEPVSYPNFLDYQKRGALFQSLALFRHRRLNVASGQGSERVRGAYVSADFFRTLGVVPALGRDFAAGEDQPGRDRVAVVSERFWRRILGGDAGAIGRTIRVDGVPFGVIGVAPAGQGYPAEADIWVPISHEAPWLRESRGLQGYTVLGRLTAGTDAARAQTQMASIAAALAAEYPVHNEGWTIRLQPFQEALSGDLRSTLLLLFGSAGILLLVTAVNLANMLLARSASRHREIAVRRAVGAGDARLVRQLLTENLVLSALGGGLGLLGAVWGVHVWRAAWEDPSSSPSMAGVDWRVLSFAGAVTVTTALLFGLAPAMRTTRAGLGEMLRQGAATVRVRHSGRFLVAGEIGLALVLAIGGTLLVRSLLRLQAVDPGFDATGVLTARISLPAATYSEPKQIIAFYQRLLQDVSALPGVEAAGAADAVPMHSGGSSFGFSIRGRATPPVQDWPIAYFATTTPEYFKALRIRASSGRLIEPRDNPSVPDVVVINETMARTFWPGQSPIGARVTFDAGQKNWIEVVGVVPDIKTRELSLPAEPQVFLAHAQWGDPALTLVVRTAADPLQLAAPIQAILRRMDPEIPLAEARTMEQALGASLLSQRLRTAILAGFASLALLLAGVGIYGVLAYVVAQREREIAVRMALGASRSGVVGGIIAHSLRLATPGVLLGLAGALASARILRSFLYEVEPTDPLTIVLVASGVSALVIAAALVPARRAARTNVMSVLRSE